MRKLGTSLGASIQNLERARYSKRQREALDLARYLREILDPRDAERLAAEYACLTQNPDAPRWTFAMISPAQNAAVVRWLTMHSKRPQKAVQLWAELFTAMHPTSGEIMATRADLAARVGIEPRTVSELMAELAKINAISKEKRGKTVRYSMNPAVATHLPDPGKRAEARAAAGPLLIIMEGGKNDT